MNEPTQIFASIITIGDELLIGQVIDTNSAFIAQELNKIGIAVKHRVAVGDNWNDIIDTLDQESKRSKIVIITGGLGPTADDITKPLLCHYFNGKMVLDQPTLEHLEHIFKEVLKRPMIERNRKQAEVPNVCTVLKNDVGTAPGMMFEKDEVLFFALPGVPYEMKWIVENHIISILKNKFQNIFIEHKTLLTAGMGESFLADRLIDFEASLPLNIKMAYLPNYGMVRLRLTGNSNDHISLIETINTKFNELKILVKDILVVDEDVPMEEVIGKLLTQHKKTLSTAESCTGGYISHLLTAKSGASNFFEGGVVSYSYSVKENVLSIEKNILETYGAVSEETVNAMAANVMKLMNTDYAIAVSGIMGPNGGTKDKPVGSVWVAVASKNIIKTKLFKFRFDRNKNIQLTSINALNMLRELIVN